MARFALFSLLFLSFRPGFAAEERTYLNEQAWDAQRITAGIIATDPQTLSESEKSEWVRARLAAIPLARLQSKEDEALRLFAGCGVYCGKYGREAEWKAVKAWGCQKKRDIRLCL
jgi:hypothetical protein